MDFPRLVYMSAAVHQAVNNSTEYTAALKAGYYPSVPEAVAKKLNTPVDTSITLYKGREQQKVPDQSTADALITGDGWYLTAEDAKRAAWPLPESVGALIADLRSSPVEHIKAEAVYYGVPVGKPGVMLSALETRLLAGFDNTPAA